MRQPPRVPMQVVDLLNEPELGAARIRPTP